MELVTGFAGQAHVDPIDMAHVNAVAFGHDAYLLDTQNKLEPTLETANKLVVDTGDLMIQGHHFTVVQSEEIALQSGVSGQKRNALVCARYEKAEGTGVESASWIVKYGTATTGTPADPSVITGNILDGVDSVHDEPIFRIEYDGITPGDPILLVPEFQSNAKFRDSISQSEELDIPLSNVSAGSYTIARSGSVVIVSLNNSVLSGGIPANGYVVLSSNMPKPICYTRATLKVHKESRNYIVETVSCSIGLDGVITIMNTNTAAGIGTGNIVDGELVYLTND
jgi:hypothetical protein